MIFKLYGSLIVILLIYRMLYSRLSYDRDNVTVKIFIDFIFLQISTDSNVGFHSHIILVIRQPSSCLLNNITLFLFTATIPQRLVETITLSLQRNCLAVC
jgi:hypothetical protein